MGRHIGQQLDGIIGKRADAPYLKCSFPTPEKRHLAQLGEPLVAVRSVHSPPVAQELQQLWRKHDIAVYAPFACSTRITILSLSISLTFRQTASETRSPAA